MKRTLLFMLTACIAATADAAVADCRSQIDATLQSVASVREQARTLTAEQQRRVENFLQDAETLLDSATRECNEANTSLDRVEALGKALIAQGNVAAARAFLEAF